jgi:hypothetical protein
VTKEREILAQVISHLDEIDRRKLFSDLKYSSIYQYCMKELGHTEDQAYRRVSALRLSRKGPLVKDKIEEGTLPLTNANLLSGFFKEVKDLDFDKEKMIVSEETPEKPNGLVSPSLI